MIMQKQIFVINFSFEQWIHFSVSNTDYNMGMQTESEERKYLLVDAIHVPIQDHLG